MSARPDLAALSADLGAHLARTSREVTEIEALAAAAAGERTALWAIAGRLMSFYTGCEAVLSRAVERFEGLPASGVDSHVRLLQAATLDITGVRPPIIRESTSRALDPYRAFRHFFRHGYGVELEWPRMEAKVRGVRSVHDAFAADISAFRGFLDSAARA